MIVPAFRGRTNTERLKVLEDGEPVNLAAIGITAAKAVVQGQAIDASVIGEELVYHPGQFDLQPGHYQLQVVVFRADDPDGEVIAGPGLPTSIELQYHR